MTDRNNSYRQKIARYWSYMNSEAGSEATNTQIYRHFEHTTYGMRKKDSLKALKALREAQDVIRIINNSDMHSSTQKRLRKEFYKAARDQTDRGKREYRKKLSNKRKKAFDKKGKKASVDDIRKTLFKRIVTPVDDSEYIEFYN